jgi:hypothetical protein
MNPSIESLKRRHIRHYRVQVSPDPVTVTVEMPTGREIKVGVSIGLTTGSRALDSGEVDVAVIGQGYFNPIAFPREGALPELRSGGRRAAVAAFRFEAAEEGARPARLELKLRSKSYLISLRKRAAKRRAEKNDIPPTVAKLLPTSWPRRRPK